MRHNSARIASTSSSTTTMSSVSAGAPIIGTARQLSVESNKPSSQHLQQLQQQLQQIDDNWVELRDKRYSSNASASNRQSLKCDASDKTCASGDSKINTATLTQTTANSNTTAGSSTTNSNMANNASSIQDCVGVEESCLLGIDCNERTTIGLVVPILADTTIHLDGDG